MCVPVIVFFFKQKTAYEMRISDWSSDVCSSDLLDGVEFCWIDDGQLRCRNLNPLTFRAHYRQSLAGFRVLPIGHPVECDQTLVKRISQNARLSRHGADERRWLPAGAAGRGDVEAIQPRTDSPQGITCLVTAENLPNDLRFFPIDLAQAWYRFAALVHFPRSEEHTSELQSLMRISYAVFCLKKKKEN